MKTFEHFPAGTPCILCGETTDSECILVAIDGTEEGSIEQATPVHTSCINLRWRKDANLIYQRVKP